MPLRSERRFISISNVKPGMMIEFNYTKKSGGGGSYIILVVDPNRKNERATEPQLHGFVIDELTDEQLIEFFSSFRKSINIDYKDRKNERATEPQLHGFVIDELTDEQLIEFFSSFRKSINIDYKDRQASIIEGLNTDEAYNTFATSKYVKDRSYRTFNLTGMSQVRQILLGSVGD